MRKVRFFALMMTLPLLTGCGGGKNEALEQALAIRAQRLEQKPYAAEIDLTADYGQRVYDFTVAASGNEEGLTLTLTAPESVAGITARLEKDAALLEYDGVMVETGPLNEEGLTPISAVPALLECLRSGYIAACGYTDQGLLRLDCSDPEGQPGSGTEYLLLLDPATGSLLRGEISRDGVRCITATFSEKEF